MICNGLMDRILGQAWRMIGKGGPEGLFSHLWSSQVIFPERGVTFGCLGRMIR